MSALTCLVIDDEAAAIATLSSYIHSTEGLQFLGGIQDPIVAKELFGSGVDLPDIVFLDMEMKGITGDQLAKIIAGKVMIIFSTAYPDFAVKSYEYGAIDYLLKPFSYERFKKAIEKCHAFMERSFSAAIEKSESITIADSRTGNLRIVEKDKIVYVSAFGNYCKVFLEDGDQLMPLKSLVNIYNALQSDKFMRVHRSWVIHIKHIKAFNKDFVTLKDGQEIKLGRVYKTDFKKWIKRHGLI